MFPSLVADSPAPPSGTWFNLALVLDSPMPPEGTRGHPMVIAEDEDSDHWSLPPLEGGSDNKGEEIGVLKHRGSRHSPNLVAPSPTSPKPMSGTKDHPTLMEESPLPMSGTRDCPCLIVEPPEHHRGSGAQVNHQCL